MNDNSRSLIPRPDVSLATVPQGSKRILSDMVSQSLVIARRPDEPTSILDPPTRLAAIEYAEALLAEGITDPQGFARHVLNKLGFNSPQILSALWNITRLSHANLNLQELNELQWQSLIQSESETKIVTVEPGRFNLGTCELCEPDYRQVLIWAQLLAMEPETVVNKLIKCGANRPWEPMVLSPADPGYTAKQAEAMEFASSLFQDGEKSGEDVLERFKTHFGDHAEDRIGKVAHQFSKLPSHLQPNIDWRSLESQLYFERWEARLGVPAEVLAGDVVQNGRIVRLHWDFLELPLEHFEWVEGLQITCLTFSNLKHSRKAITALPLLLPKLRCLSCEAMGLTQLDLSSVRDLRRLECGRNQLTALDLSDVLKLTALDCGDNEIDELRLTNVPLLRELICGDNRLTELDVSSIPYLTGLYCANNRLKKLDVGRTPELDWLNCMGNHITELDITSLRRVRWVAYDDDKTQLIHRPDQEGV